MVSVACFSERPEDAVAIGKAAGFEVFALPHPRGFAGKARNALAQLARGRPLQYTFLDTPQIRGLLQSVAGRFDAVVVQELSMVGVAISTGLHRNLPTILDELNAEYPRAVDMRPVINGRLARIRHEAHTLALQRFEPWAVAMMSGCIFVSQSDQEAVMKAAGYPPVASIVVPSGVHISSRVKRARARTVPNPVIAFVGSFDYAPNAFGAHWLVEEVMPRVRRTVPAQLHLIGRRPPPQITAMRAIEWVRLHSDPVATSDAAHLAPLLAAADVVAVPIHHGGGTKLKTLEGLASGAPVVTTSAGAQGIDVRDGEHLLIADDAERFANALVSVLTDRQLATRLSNAGWAASQRYSWTRIGATYTDFVLSFLGIGPEPYRGMNGGGPP